MILTIQNKGNYLQEKAKMRIETESYYQANYKNCINLYLMVVIKRIMNNFVQIQKLLSQVN